MVVEMDISRFCKGIDNQDNHIHNNNSGGILVLFQVRR